MGTNAAIARGYRADAGLVPEPTRFNLWVATRGLLHGTLSVQGRSAHAEMNQPPWEEGGGVNAIQKTTYLLGALDGLSEDWARRASKRHPLLGTPSVNPTQISGGTFISNVPERCDVALNTTYLPGDADDAGYGSVPRGEIEQAVREAAAQDGWLAAHPPSWSWYTDYPPSEIDPETPILGVVQAAGRELGVDVRPRGHRHHLRRRAPDALRRHAEPGLRPGRPEARPCTGRVGRRGRARPRRQALRPRDRGLVRARGGIVSVARLRLAPAGETMFPPRAPFLQSNVVEPPGSPTPPPHAHRPEVGPMSEPVVVRADETHVFPRELDRAYPLIDRAEGVWLYDREGNAFLDAVGGGAMVASIGHGVPEIVEAARAQAARVSFLYNQQFTTVAQERLADRLTALAPPGFTRVHFVTGGAEANETALRLARSYHVERGDTARWRIVSPAQAYHGPTVATLALTGRPGLQAPYEPYLAQHPHIPPSTWRFDPSGEAALAALDAALEEVGPETVSAFFCEPVSAAALPAYAPPRRFWEGLAERRERHGFLICLDEVVTGLGRTGTWFAADRLPFVPDVITTAKGLGAGYAPIGAMLCREEIYDAVAAGSRAFEHGHTWDGAPLPCAVGLAVLDYLERLELLERVRETGPRLRRLLESALADCELVREVRGHGYLLGIDYVDPSDGVSFLDPALGIARKIDVEALARGLIVYSTQPTADGYAGDQTLIAPAFTSTEEELNLMVERMTETVRAVERWVKSESAVPA